MAVKPQNVVGSMKSNQRIDLTRLRMKMPDLEVRDRAPIWGGLALRPRGFLQIFPGGTVMLMGLKSEEEFFAAASEVQNVLESHGTGPFSDAKIHFISSTCKFEIRGNLGRVATCLGDKMAVDYEPEQYACLIARTPPITILLFASGKATLTGARSVAEADQFAAEFQIQLDACA